MKKIHTLTLSSMDRKRERKLTRSVTEQQQQKKNCCNSTNIGMRLILEYGRYWTSTGP